MSRHVYFWALIFCFCFVYGWSYYRFFIDTPCAPAPLGPFSQGVLAENLLFITAQLGKDPVNNEMVAGGAYEETKQALRNIGAICSAARGSLDDVVKLTNYLKDIKDLPEVNRAYEEIFRGKNYPARASFQVASLPADGVIEIEGIAVIGRNH